jgi:hypothetical protein
MMFLVGISMSVGARRDENLHSSGHAPDVVLVFVVYHGESLPGDIGWSSSRCVEDVRVGIV